MFHCEKCGLCCMHIGKVSLYKGLDRGDGVCRFPALHPLFHSHLFVRNNRVFHIYCVSLQFIVYLCNT